MSELKSWLASILNSAPQLFSIMMFPQIYKKAFFQELLNPLTVQNLFRQIPEEVITFKYHY